jgi:dolichol-phosphate hexosyltransferase
MRIVLLIPTLNEAATIADAVTRGRKHVDAVIVIDGGSTDDTVALARDAGSEIIVGVVRGKGAALRRAFSSVEADIFVDMDADGSHDADDIPRLLAPILDGTADLVIGSRMSGGSDELVGDFNKFLRMTGSNIITMAINKRFGLTLTDSQNGFRAIRAGLAKSLGCTEDIFTIEQEMLIRALKRGARVTEVPTHESRRVAGESHIRLGRVWWRFVWSCAKNIVWSP